MGQLQQFDAAKTYNKYLMSINVSLNSDLNWRFFEIIAAGGCLVTDKLPEESGITTLFEPNIDYIEYSNKEELMLKLDYYMNNPREAMEIAKNGNNKYRKKLLPLIMKKEIVKLLLMEEKEKSTYRYEEHKDEAFISLRGYQSIQEIHRRSEYIRVTVSKNIDKPKLFAEISDYPRILDENMRTWDGNEVFINENTDVTEVFYGKKVEDVLKTKHRREYDYIIIDEGMYDASIKNYTYMQEIDCFVKLMKQG